MLLAVACWTLIACDAGRDPYVGTWKSKSNAENTIQIEKNGESYLISAAETGLRGRQERKLPASFVDGMLRIENGLGGISLAYVEKSKTLIASNMMGSDEYQRVK